jgi:hypothetical protein
MKLATKTYLLLSTVAALLVFAASIAVIRNLNDLPPLIGSNSTTNTKFVDIIDCLSLPSDQQEDCMNKFVVDYAEQNHKDIPGLLADEELARAQSTQFENSCHEIVHSIGRFAYQKLGNVGDAFQACNQSCHSGCYHGVMERMFFSDEEEAAGEHHVTYAALQEKVPGICDPDKFANPSPQVIFQCLHGVGHAIMFSLKYDLRLALQTCDLLQTEYQRSSCYGGVVMENITAFDKDKRDIKTDDPLYPCDALESKYQQQCYMMQTSIMSELGMTTQQIIDTCRQATPGQNVYPCFVSLGRDLSNYVRTGDTQRVVQACEVDSGIEQRACFEGVLYALVDNTWDGKYAYEFCDALGEDVNKESCYKITNGYFNWGFNKTKDQILEQCDKYSKHVEMCKQTIY